ncbi:MAG: hypothetical protein IJY36_06645 [Coprobacter sp.]|nr:hypothetical protein [Coprobacter sp.]
MKKIVFILAFLWAATSIAQNKAVAVTEVVDKEDKVSYAIEVMVRTKLTAAISKKQGYTAYDRVDLQSIMTEQNFQRTGLVDEATIKKLGEMTGASLVMIPEVVLSDDGKIYVAVKMLDVSSAQTMMVSDQLMGNASIEVEEGCLALVTKVLGMKSENVTPVGSSDKPITLFGYITIFPSDIGEFQTLPAQLLSAINKKATYGYDTWRLPTADELSIMRANSNMIPNFKNADYLCADSTVGGFARLVTTEPTKSVRDEARKKTLYDLLCIPHDEYWRILEEERILFCVRNTDDVFDSYGGLIIYQNASIPTEKQMLIFRSHLTSDERSEYFVVSNNDGNVDTDYRFDDGYFSYLKVKAKRYNDASLTWRIIQHKYDSERQLAYVILYYNFPSEEIIRKEMLKYY